MYNNNGIREREKYESSGIVYLDQVFDGNNDQLWRKKKYLLIKNNKDYYKN